ncbi:MAG: hypothetical protein N3C12_11805 [Candidatus Binatia bacterium]|nr:hypothetical protein [Candidatus Binatia bacterium]
MRRRCSERTAGSFLVFLFALSSLGPPVGMVAHSHRGEDRPHVHLSLLSWSWRFSAGERQEAELPFAGDDTPVDWWAHGRERQGAAEPAWRQGPRAVGPHIHVFSPVQPSLPALPLATLALDLCAHPVVSPPPLRLPGARVSLRSRSPPFAALTA